MPTLNVYTPGNPETLFNTIASPIPQYPFGDGLEVTSFDYGTGTFEAEGTHTQFQGSFKGHYEDGEWLLDSGIVTSLRTVTDEGYPLVEITGLDMSVADAFSKVVSVTATQLRAWIESQSWTINGSAGSDTLAGGNRSDEITASSGADILNGLGGNDILEGGSGGDSLAGGGGHDYIHGGKGVDILTGNSGRDTFVIATGDGKDRVTDFVNGIDHFDVSGWKDMHDFADIKTHLYRSGENVIIKDGTDWLTIDNTVKADLNPADFIF